MKRLTILYDANCGVCRRCRTWLERQATYVLLEFVPLQAKDLPRRFPGIGKLDLDKEIVVISDTGEVWQGGEAWVMCLWALREYREWSQRLAHPVLLPLARRACAIFSGTRHRISRLLPGDAGMEEWRRSIESLPVETNPCNGDYCKPL